MRIVCMIPARLGSKRVKSKNLRLLDGKPLVAHVAQTALAARVFDAIYINSESMLFADMANEYGVSFYQRPMALADDHATNDMFVKDFVEHIPCDIIVQINPTAPLLTVDDVQQFVHMMVNDRYDTLHTVKSEQIEGLYEGQPLNFDPLKPMPRSQDLKPVMLFSSAIMAWRVDNYLKNLETLKAGTYGGHGRIGYFVLKGFSTIDIDHEEDFQFAQLAIDYRRNPQASQPQYYETQATKALRHETDVPSILAKDGVHRHDFDHENQTIVNLGDILAEMGEEISWSRRLINTESNSATLISQLPGEGNRLHHHSDWNEWWYIVKGQWSFEIEGKIHTVKQGDVVLIPKNKWHKITAIGHESAVRLAVSKDKVAHIYKEESAV